MRIWDATILAFLGCASIQAHTHLNARQPPPKRSVPSQLEEVATLDGPMPTGVVVSKTGRIFLCFPRWGDKVPATLGEYRNRRLVPFPSAAWAGEKGDPGQRFISVQSVVTDALGRLWALDTGLGESGPVSGGAKLVCLDAEKGTILKRISFLSEIMLPGTYLNDVRFDLNRGPEGTAFITDSSSDGPNGILVVDLASSRVQRRLAEHPSVKADPAFRPVVEGAFLQVQMPGAKAQPFHVGSDGLALSPDGKLLYYCPLSARRLYAISTDLLADPSVSESALGAAVQDLGEKPASDGLEMDARGNLFATAYEHNAIFVRKPDGQWETLVSDARLFWPDSMALGADGSLYVTANQLHRQASFHKGVDMRKPPYRVFRINQSSRFRAPLSHFLSQTVQGR